MKAASLSVQGALEIQLDAYSDDRGLFKETFVKSKYARIGITDEFLQDNFSKSRRLVLRGLHGDPRMAKLIQVVQGKAFDVIVDLRPKSPTYRRWCGLHLSSQEHTQLYIPAGCLHGFLALEDDTILSYKQTAEYDPKTEFAVAWNDPDLAIDWPLNGATPILSPKDAANPTIRQLGHL